MDSIKYFCYYDILESRVKRNYTHSATNKLNYIWQVLNHVGYRVDAISLSNCIEEKFLYVSGSRISIGNENYLRLFPSFGGPKLFRVLGRYWLFICFFFWFLFNVRKGEKIIVYHSLGYCKLLTILKSLTGCKIIGEIEEIYQDVLPQKATVARSEYKFIEKCDAYIFPTNFLNVKLNCSNKPSVLVHGIYALEPFRDVCWEDSKIHVVYAGTFDPNKGCQAAANAARFLPEGYHIHICGFGTKEDTDAICKLIEQIRMVAKSTITYDGLLKGEDFIRFIQKCHVGLSTQSPDAAFNATSFPSKVLTYMANGLKVVSIRIPAIEHSRVSNYISYYDDQIPEEIAKAIVTCMENNRSSCGELLENLDRQFKNDMEQLIRHM